MADAPTYRPTPPVPDENFGGAFVLLNCLYAEGVREIFGLPGGAVSELTTAMQRRGDIEFILARHEQGAGFMAYGHAKATKRAAVCLSTQGPGACNLVNVAGSATVDKVPLIILTGVASNATHFRRGFQNIDTKELFKPVTKWSVSITDPSSIPEIVYDAFKCAMTWPYGAVHIELPKNVASAQIDPKAPEFQPFTRLAPSIPNVPSDDSLGRLWSAIKDAKAPIILVGPDIWRNTGGLKGRDELRRFCDMTNIGVVMIPGAKGAVDPVKDYCLYTVALIFPDYPNLAISASDLVITVGYDRAEYDTAMWSTAARATNIIHIGASEPIVEALYKPKMQIIGNIGVILDALNKFIIAHEPEGGIRRWNVVAHQTARAQSQASFAERTTDDSSPWVYQQRIVADIQKCTDQFRTKKRHVTLVLDSGGSQLWMLRNWNCLTASELVSSNQFASMGIGLPAAIGIAYQNKQRNKPHRVLALLGDGGFVMNLQEMETATRLELNLVVIVWVNDTLGLVEWGDQTEYGDYMPFQFRNPKVVELASAFGWNGIEVTSSQLFLPTISNALNSDGRTLIFVRCYPNGDLDLSDKLEKDCGAGGGIPRLLSASHPARPMHNSYK